MRFDPKYEDGSLLNNNELRTVVDLFGLLSKNTIWLRKAVVKHERLSFFLFVQHLAGRATDLIGKQLDPGIEVRFGHRLKLSELGLP